MQPYTLFLYSYTYFFKQVEPTLIIVIFFKIFFLYLYIIIYNYIIIYIVYYVYNYIGYMQISMHLLTEC